MVFPVQIRTAVPGDRLDFPDELEALLARAPAVDSAVRGLPVGIFLSAEVQRIGDPLFGQLRRLGALSGSDIALIPVAVRRWSGGCGWGVGRRDRRDHRERPERPGDLVRDRRWPAKLSGRLRVGGFSGGVSGRNVVVVRTVESDTD